MKALLITLFSIQSFIAVAQTPELKCLYEINAIDIETGDTIVQSHPTNVSPAARIQLVKQKSLPLFNVSADLHAEVVRIGPLEDVIFDCIDGTEIQLMPKGLFKSVIVPYNSSTGIKEHGHVDIICYILDDALWAMAEHRIRSMTIQWDGGSKTYRATEEESLALMKQAICLLRTMVR
jgi:hypothetical protein